MSWAPHKHQTRRREQRRLYSISVPHHTAPVQFIQYKPRSCVSASTSPYLILAVSVRTKELHSVPPPSTPPLHNISRRRSTSVVDVVATFISPVCDVLLNSSDRSSADHLTRRAAPCRPADVHRFVLRLRPTLTGPLYRRVTFTILDYRSHGRCTSSLRLATKTSTHPLGGSPYPLRPPGQHALSNISRINNSNELSESYPPPFALPLRSVFHTPRTLGERDW